MFTKLLIANRGEIACRIIKTAQAMGIKTVALYSDADKDARHVAMADESFYLGGSAPSESYLKGGLILEIAKRSGAQAIHPGYGFLSENADFARQCEQAGIAFVGPGADAIDAMGSKSAAKIIMEKANVPLVPGYHGDDQSDEVLLKASKEIGFPQLIKAAYGGGGKGMRIVESESEALEAINSARREAASSFGNDKLLIERYLRQPRHVEVQVFADTQGNCIYLSDRDCSIQRRHQKVVEEAPAPGLSDSLRRAMGEAAVAAAKAIDYVGAGTVEFLLDTHASDETNSFYFMEMNTRIQVEHTITEMVTGVDLLALQLTIAQGEPLELSEAQVTPKGHAIECRINAEHPRTFTPSPGQITQLQVPGGLGVRWESHLTHGYDIPPYYDAMIAKLITWGDDRTQAIARMRTALDELTISGIDTNIPLLKALLADPKVQQGETSIHYLEDTFLPGK